MRNIIVLLFCGVLVGVRSDCGDPECAEELIKQILEEEPTEADDVDLNINVPEFKQVKNVEIKDINGIILGLSKWFQHKLNESNFIYKSVNNKTKIFVKSFDFNVDFESGNARIDMDLLKADDQKNNESELIKIINRNNNKTTSTVTEIDNISNNITEAIGKNIDAMIESQKNLDGDDIYNTVDFDTTYYDANEDKNETDYPTIDYIDMYKDTTAEEHVYTGTELPTTLPQSADQNNETEEVSFESLLNDTSMLVGLHVKTFKDTVFPWVATIFIKNSTEVSQFHYFCDGALLSERVILTGARCLHHTSGLVPPENILVFLGKTNLQAMGSREKLHRIKKVIVHHNFSVDLEGRAQNDLAVLVLDSATELDDRIQTSCIHHGDSTEIEEAATTAWGPSGQLLPIFFEKEESDDCFMENKDIFCATYSPNTPLCPSYGGIYATKRMSRWCLQGIFYGDPTNRGLCFNKNVLFTSLRNYYEWIDDYIVINANIL